MLGQARIREVVDDSLRECAGMLRRRMRAGTVLRVLGVCAALVLLGAEALAAHDPTLLAIGAALVATVWLAKSRPLRLALAAGGLELRNRARRRSRFVRAREFVDAGADARVQRASEKARRFRRYYPLHEPPVECFPAFDVFTRHREPTRAPGVDQRPQ